MPRTEGARAARSPATRRSRQRRTATRALCTARPPCPAAGSDGRAVDRHRRHDRRTGSQTSARPTRRTEIVGLCDVDTEALKRRRPMCLAWFEDNCTRSSRQARSLRRAAIGVAVGARTGCRPQTGSAARFVVSTWASRAAQSTRNRPQRLQPGSRPGTLCVRCPTASSIRDRTRQQPSSSRSLHAMNQSKPTAVGAATEHSVASRRPRPLRDIVSQASRASLPPSPGRPERRQP